MTNISETVHTSLRSHGYGDYTQYAAPVIADLEAREAQIVEALTQYAQERGLSGQDVQVALVEIGLKDPEPEPFGTEAEVVHEGDDDRLSALLASVERLSASVSALEGVARSRGLI